jgi:DNA-binding response OmpR family regulator
MGPRILLVESEIVSRGKISQFLSSGGYSVKEADSGRAALNLLDTFSFDLVVSDFRLMDGTEGVDVLAYADGLQPGVLTVLLGRASDLRRCGSINAAWVSKPVQLEELRLKIGLLLIHQTCVTELPPATRITIASIRSQRAWSVIQGERFQELCFRLQETRSRNLLLRERALELKGQLQDTILNLKEARNFATKLS